MIYLAKHNIFIKNPSEIEGFDVEVKNYIYDKLDKGLVSFVIPKEYENTSHIDEKKHKKNYKVGFLYDLISEVYADKTKTMIYEIISTKYHLWFTYRQFFSIIHDYEKDRNKYLLKPSLLFI